MQFPGREDDPNRLSYNSLSEFAEQKHKFSAECGEKKRGRRMGHVVPWSTLFVDSALFSRPMGGHESNPFERKNIPMTL